MKRPVSFLVLALLVYSCSKSGTKPKTGTGVYVAGTDGVNPILWSNGNPQKLDSNGGFASQVVLSGKEVYVAGFSNVDTTSPFQPPGVIAQFTYWKNGKETTIGGQRYIGAIPSMAVNGENIYFCSGQVYENGSVIPLQGQGLAYLASAVGGDVYFAGNDSVGDGVYWKNGVLHVISGAQPMGAAVPVNCLYVSGTDVYVGGTDLQRNAAIWKNGVETIVRSSVGEPISDVHSIFVQGQDVYSVSGLVMGGVIVPAYWKNGVQVNLPLNGAAYGTAISIFVSGSDVYVCGYTSLGAALWKNGVGTVLAPRGQATSVVVQ